MTTMKTPTCKENNIKKYILNYKPTSNTTPPPKYYYYNYYNNNNDNR